MKRLLLSLPLWPSIVILVLVIYGPFLGERVIRMAGDEKVYISQTLEMIRDGRWFLQTLADQPDYYKGPLHYLFLRMGIGSLGYTLWSALYMNLILLILGALSVAAVLRKRFPDEIGTPLWGACAFAFCIGIYTHMFASQMEVELACFFAIGMNLLNDDEPSIWRTYAFWLLAGLAGWLKSPLHSVLLGLSALLYWTWTRTLFERMKTASFWIAPLLGIAVCISGYLPAILLDYDNFRHTYLMRESWAKGPSGEPPINTLFPFFGHFLLPWLFIAVVAYLDFALRFTPLNLRFKRTSDSIRALRLGFSIFLPSVLFFVWHDYRAQNYNLPVICGLIVLIATIWKTHAPGFSRLYRIAIGMTGIYYLLLPILATVVCIHFFPMPDWWGLNNLFLCWMLSGFSFLIIISELIHDRPPNPGWLAFSQVGHYLAVGALIVNFGTRELLDLKHFIAENPKTQLSYYNLNKNLWSEWAHLGLMLGKPVQGLHTEETLKRAVDQGYVILIQKSEHLENFKRIIQENYPGRKIETKNWRRWRTHGKNENGDPLWLDAWKKRDFSIMEVNYFITQVKGT